MDFRKHLRYVDGRLTFDACSLASLAQEFGTPLYVYSATAVAESFRELQAGLGDRPHLICYAIKANGNLHLLRELAALGCGGDIVSGGELFRARQAGIAPDRIVFSGVGKTRIEMREALEENVLLFIVESLGELEALSEVATELGVVARISVRVNPNIDPKTHPYISTGLRENKFGIPHQEAPAVFRRALELPGIEPVGIGTHIGSQLTDLSPFRDAARLLTQLAAAVRSQGVDLRYVDMGGGLGIRYAAEEPPAPRDYAATFLEHLDVPDTTLILEPGRSLVGNAGVLLTRVLYLKAGPEKQFVVCDAGMNDLLRPALYQAYHDVLPVEESRQLPKTIGDLVGPVCETGDFLARNRELPHAAPGDLLALASAGAYGFSMSSNYNARPRAAEVLVREGQSRLIRRRESYADLIAAELV